MAISPVLKNSPLLNELFNHPYWKQYASEYPSGSSLQIRSLEIIEDAQNSSCFQLRLHLINGKTLLAPFWADTSLGKWCFKNALPHTYNHLPEMFSEIFQHLEKGETLVGTTHNISQ